MDKLFQRKNKIHSAYYTGQGKVEEISHLKQFKNVNIIIFDDELSKVISQRNVQKVKRTKNNISKVAIVGYTNAGKSTLRNKLCEISAANNVNKEGVLEADMIFATLDTTVRAINLNEEYIEEGTYVKALVYEEIYKRCMEFEMKALS